MIRVGLRTCLWKREETATRCLKHYHEMVPKAAELGVELILVAVHSQTRRYLESVGGIGSRWEFVRHANSPLRNKLRAGLAALRGRDILFALNIGGDDFVGLPSIMRLVREFQTGADFTGWGTAYIAHADKGVHFWPGYQGARSPEPFGPGRGLSPRLLEALEWDPWKNAPFNNMDGTYWKRLKALCPDADKRILPSSELGPIVDVKDSESFTPWHRTAKYNKCLTRAEGQAVLEQVGLGDLLRG